jgi:hypothetical protein
MSDYKVVVVGTDGSDTSLRAVDKAAAIAAEAAAKLIVATAFLPEDEGRSGEPDQLKGENYRTEGNAPVYGMLRDAADRARAAGAKDVEERAIAGAPIDVLLDLVDDGRRSARGRQRRRQFDCRPTPRFGAQSCVSSRQNRGADRGDRGLTSTHQYRAAPENICASVDFAISMGAFCRSRCCGHAPSASVA